MNKSEVISSTAPRNHSHLVSLVIIAKDVHVTSASFVSAVAHLSDRYEFFEIIVLSTSTLELKLDEGSAFVEVPSKVRSVVFHGRPGYDEMAAYGYVESIGDMVLVVPAEELALLDLETVLQPLILGRDLVRVRRGNAGFLGLVGSRFLEVVTGNHVDTRFYRTIGIGRQMLSRLNAFPDQLSLLRFAGSCRSVDQAVVLVDGPAVRSAWRAIPGRVDLSARLLSLSAPRLLRQCSVMCGLVAAASMGVVLYVVAVWFLKTEIAEGWTSTTLLMACWMSVQSLAMAVLCLGTGRLLDSQGARRSWRISGDTSVGDLFAGARFINVEDAGIEAGGEVS